MAGRDFQTRGFDIFDDIGHGINKVDGRVDRLKNNTRPTVPRYNFLTDDPGDKPLNPSEGQVAVGQDDNFLHYYVNGEWRSGVSGNWKDIDFLPPWVESGLPWGPSQYMLLGGEYFFRGSITGGTNTDKVTVIEVDDRPEFQRRFLISRNYNVAFLDLYTNGDVYLIS